MDEFTILANMMKKMSDGVKQGQKNGKQINQRGQTENR